jgi:hypothetical protein
VVLKNRRYSRSTEEQHERNFGTQMHVTIMQRKIPRDGSNMPVDGEGLETPGLFTSSQVITKQMLTDSPPFPIRQIGDP